MSSRPLDVISSASAQEIETYCHALAQELGLTMTIVGWTAALSPHHVEDPCHLMLRITKPFQAPAEFWFTCAQVLGYTTGETKELIEHQIRTELETRLREDR